MTNHKARKSSGDAERRQQSNWRGPLALHERNTFAMGHTSLEFSPFGNAAALPRIHCLLLELTVLEDPPFEEKTQIMSCFLGCLDEPLLLLGAQAKTLTEGCDSLGVLCNALASSDRYKLFPKEPIPKENCWGKETLKELLSKLWWLLNFPTSSFCLCLCLWHGFLCRRSLSFSYFWSSLCNCRPHQARTA